MIIRQKTCVTCGKTFETKDHRQHYCCLECKRVQQRRRTKEYYRNYIVPHNQVADLSIKVPCANPECKKLFRRKVANQLYCSKACRRFVESKEYNKIRIKKIKKVCDVKYSIEELSLIEKWYRVVHGIIKHYGEISYEVEFKGKEYDLNAIRSEINLAQHAQQTRC